MRVIISTLLLMVCGNLFAATNPKWDFSVEQVTAEGEAGFHWTLSSKHPDKDVTVIMKLIGINNNPNNMNGWELEYAFGPDAHDPKEMSLLQVDVNLETVKLNRNIYGRSVISKNLPSDVIESIHDILDNGTEDDPGKRQIYMRYVTPDTHDPDKWSWENGVVAKFDMKDWDRAYHALLEDVKKKGASALTLTTKQLRNWPINKLPQNTIKPKPSEMQAAAEKAGIDIDAAYELSINKLVQAIADNQAAILVAKKEAEAEAARKAEQAAKAAKEAEERAKKDKMARALRDFDWPYHGCDRPSLPRAGASQSARDRFNDNKGDWGRCLDDTFPRDRKAIYNLIDKIGGSWERKDGQVFYSTPRDCDCQDEISQLMDESHRRHDNREAQWERLQSAIDDWNDRDMSQVQRDEFWDGIDNSLNDMNREMERMNQQRQQQWNNQIYVTPGYY